MSEPHQQEPESTRPERVFLTGATGFLGGMLARQLRAEGVEVVCLVRTPSKATELAAMGCEVCAGDITDKASVLAAMAGCDVLYHCAAWYETGSSADALAYEINVVGSRNVFEAMAELGLRKGVYTSSLAVFSDSSAAVAAGRTIDESYRFDGKHGSIYDRTKWQAHYEVALPMIEAGLPLVVLQPGVIYGPGDHSAIHDVWQLLVAGKLPAVPGGTVFAWAHVEDVARAHRQAMAKGRPGETYIVCGESMGLMEVATEAAALAGVPAPKLQMPRWLLRGLAVLLTPVARWLEGGQYHPETLRSSAGVYYVGDNSKARRELGYAPRTLREGLPETIRWELEQAGRTVPAQLAAA